MPRSAEAPHPFGREIEGYPHSSTSKAKLIEHLNEDKVPQLLGRFQHTTYASKCSRLLTGPWSQGRSHRPPRCPAATSHRRGKAVHVAVRNNLELLQRSSKVVEESPGILNVAYGLRVDADDYLVGGYASRVHDVDAVVLQGTGHFQRLGVGDPQLGDVYP